MDIDVYLAEHVIRDRLAEARARAEFAARLGSLPANGLGRRLLEFGRSLVTRRGRKAAGTRRPLEGGTLDELHGETTVL